MPTVHANKPQKVLPFRIPKEGVVGYRVLNPILFFILGKLGIKVSYDGDIAEIEGGVHLKGGTTAATTADHPFLVTAFSDGGTLKFRVAAGTFHGVIPTLGGAALNAATPPSGTLGAGTRVVYLKVTSTLATNHGFVYGATFSTPQVEAAAAVPSDNKATGTYHRLIASFVDGVKTAQVINSSLDGFVEDTGAGATEADLYVF